VVLGFVSIGLTLLLTVTYQGGTVVGRGQLSITIKISRFFKIRVERGVEHRLAGKGGASGGGSRLASANSASAAYQ